YTSVAWPFRPPAPSRTEPVPAWMTLDYYGDALPLPGGPVTREPNYAGASHHIRRSSPRRQGGPMRVTTLRVFGPERPDPDGVIERAADGSRTRYRHPEFGRWTVWDVVYFTIDGSRKRFVMPAGQTEAAYY